MKTARFIITGCSKQQRERDLAESVLNPINTLKSTNTGVFTLKDPRNLTRLFSQRKH